MSTKYAIVIVVLFLLVSGVLIARNSEPKVPDLAVEEVGENVPVGSKPVSKPKPTVGENLEGEANPSTMKLDMKPWVWVSASYSDGTEVKPNAPADFRITFEPSGDFYVSTDCNSMSGKYEANEKSIDFTSIVSTKMYCVGSKESDFIKVLQNTTSFFFNSRGELVLELNFDSGTATFR